MSVKSKSKSNQSKLPTLRFRAKIILGFVAVLAILAVSMAFAYFGFERIQAAVASYRTSVSEADLARTVDRELIAYQGLARAYTLTGAVDDETAAKAAEDNLKSAIAKSMSATTGAARREQVGKLEAEFQRFTKVFGEIIVLTRENNKIAADELNSVGNKIRFKFDDLADTAALAGLASVQTTAKDITSQYLAVSTSVGAFVAKPEPKTADGVIARIKFLETLLVSIYASDQKITDRVTEIGNLLKQYRTSFAKLTENVKIIVKSNGEMTKTAATILKLSAELRSDLTADQQRIEASANATIGETEQLMLMMALGGLAIGAVLALWLGNGISRPMIAMCKAMRELASGNFDVVLPGLGRKDEIGEMAGAVEEFKVQAVAKAERDAAASEAQNREASAARRSELIRFADDFESAVGAIVSNVSASAVQLESAASTLTRTAETTQSLSSQVAGVSEQASSNMQSVATATEELSASVEEIGRQVRDSSRIAEAAVVQAKETDGRIGKLSHAAQQIGEVVKLITAIAEQTNLLALNATIEAARLRIAATDIGEVNRGAAETGSASEEVLHSAKTLSSESTRLRAELDRFMGNIRAA
ncbi:Methyl-accepting chemotaxis protein [Bradyrhizobium sp. Rc3b]|uniref:methyl-accepting chemotaxis protein n=1 Tax=Bradyrhizobium sp. Rc3b TaxID=1855322 RepID=UPI0008E5335E|nr:methyl-accepting chemotaxis protein [Bradyrhizobium sp. Rc3b]SFN52044.1 Methyl-accepting chemotaxis protein [Bradyrhizobium sp. Rc3b]